MNSPGVPRRTTSQDRQGASALPEFAHVQRLWDQQSQLYSVKILPGEFYVTTENEMIMTVLGSCISACISDPVFSIGGMNHFMLPVGGPDEVASWAGDRLSNAARYGNYAMELLINTILKQGGSRQHTDGAIEVVGTAPDPYIARHKIKQLDPDVLTLDVEMPRMDGLTFLRHLIRLRPMPVVMVSSLTAQGADITLQALELGAVDYVTKPKIDLAHSLQDYAEDIITKVKMAAHARLRTPTPPLATALRVEPKLTADAVLTRHGGARHFRTTDRLIAIGASTGGTEAIKDILSVMPADAPAMVVTQHMPEAFTASFATRLDGLSTMTVCEAREGQPIVQGSVYIAPGHSHLLVERDGARYVCRLHNGPPVNRHRPSVDVLFRSVAQHVGPNAVGVILTGMGADGAQGLKEMHEAGAPTLAQDEKTSVVWGMPGEAVKLGGVDDVLALDKMAGKILRLGRP